MLLAFSWFFPALPTRTIAFSAGVATDSRPSLAWKMTAFRTVPPSVDLPNDSVTCPANSIEEGRAMKTPNSTTNHGISK